VTDPHGELVIGIAAMDVLDRLDADLVERATPRLAAADWVFAECNSTAAALAGLAALRRRSTFRLALDAVSTAKALRLPEDLAGIDVLFLNLDEASAALGRPVPARSGDIDEARTLAARLGARGAGAVVVTLGAAGAVVAEGAGRPGPPAGDPRRRWSTSPGRATRSSPGRWRGCRTAARWRTPCASAARLRR
jgi:pseudouridine kinase